MKEPEVAKIFAKKARRSKPKKSPRNKRARKLIQRKRYNKRKELTGTLVTPSFGLDGVTLSSNKSPNMDGSGIKAAAGKQSTGGSSEFNIAPILMSPEMMKEVGVEGLGVPGSFDIRGENASGSKDGVQAEVGENRVAEQMITSPSPLSLHGMNLSVWKGKEKMHDIDNDGHRVESCMERRVNMITSLPDLISPRILDETGSRSESAS